MQESNQIIELLNNESTTFKNISYKSLDRIKLNNINNNTFSNNRIQFNTKSISSQLVLYKDAYILLEVELKFATEANALLTNLRLKNSYEIVNSLKIEINRTIITNEDYIYYSNMIPHLLENSKSDDLFYRGIDLHDDVTFKNNVNKNIFMRKVGDTVKVKIPIFLRDISDYFRQLDFAHEFGEYNISLQIVDQIYYLADNMGDITQEIKSAYLYTDVCYLNEKNKIKYVKNIDKFNKIIPIFDNHVKINDNKILGNKFTMHLNNVSNCKNMYLMFIKDDAVVKIPTRSCTDIQLKIDSQKFQNPIENNTDAFIIFKNRSPYNNESLLNYNQFLNNHLIYSFPFDRMLKYDSGSKSVAISCDPDDNDSASSIVIYQQSSYINLNIENGSLVVKKHIKYIYIIYAY